MTAERIGFVKMHGLGNDFIVIDARRARPAADPARLARAMCARRTGIGADGVLLLRPAASSQAAAAVEVWNADGSPGGMCGNGLRCVAKLLLERDGGPGGPIRAEAGGRLVTLRPRLDAGGGASWVEADMGEPVFDLAAASVAPDRIGASDPPFIEVGGERGVVVSMGNPHLVCFVDALPAGEALRVRAGGVERHPAFPDGVNVQFAAIANAGREVAAAPWERGVGATPACASGACAVLAAGVRAGLLGRSATVRMPGGDLDASWPEGSGVRCAGPASYAFEGTWPIGAAIS